MTGESLGVVVNVLNRDIIVSEFEFLSFFCVYFRVMPLGKVGIPLPTNYGVNNITTILLQGWFWH